MRARGKILYIASTFGHLASFHRPYLQWFDSQGYEVHAAAGGAPCDLEGVSRFIPLPLEKSMFSPKNLAAVWALYRLMKEERYEMISLHTSLAAFFARLAVFPLGKRRPGVMNTVHGYLFDKDTRWTKQMLLLGAERITAPVTDWLLTMNRQDAEIARRYHLGEKQMCTKGMGVDFARFTPPTQTQREELRQQLGLKPSDLVLIYAAEFSERKNQAMLIQAMQGLTENVILLLPGQGDLREACRMQAGRAGLADRVRFPGFVRDMENWYRAADICVSSSRIEGLPFNLMEAMACGLPVVASAIKGHEDLVCNGENGFLYPFGDVGAFSQAVKHLMEEKLRQRMGESARHSVQRFGIERVFPELTVLYENAVKDFR